MPYSEVSITGYNSNPPPDDGSAVSANEVTWAKHKTKLGDPLKTALETTQTNITTAIDAIESDLIPSGTKMLFQQTAAPTGWTKDTTHNNKALRIVSGTVSSGGSSAFTDVFAARTVARANLPNVGIGFSGTASGNITSGGVQALGVPNNSGLIGASGGSGFNTYAASAFGNLALTSGACSGTTNSINGGVSQETMDFAVQYVDVIIASKDA